MRNYHNWKLNDEGCHTDWNDSWKNWSFQMNWFFIDYKILRSEKIGHAHGKSKCLPDNSCDGSFLYYHIKCKNKKQRLRFQKLYLCSSLLVYGSLWKLQFLETPLKMRCYKSRYYSDLELAGISRGVSKRNLSRFHLCEESNLLCCLASVSDFWIWCKKGELKNLFCF